MLIKSHVYINKKNKDKYEMFYIDSEINVILHL